MAAVRAKQNKVDVTFPDQRPDEGYFVKPGMLAALVMAVFRGVIGLSLFDSPWGWQIVASAKAAKD